MVRILSLIVMLTMRIAGSYRSIASVYRCNRRIPLSIDVQFQRIAGMKMSTDSSSTANTNDKVGKTKLKRISDERLKEIEMEERLREASGWVSKTLSDADADKLNRLLGIDMELLGEDDDPLPKSKGRKGGKTKLPKSDKSLEPIDRSPSFIVNEGSNLDTRIRGFLELNPQICSGCGASFQTKAENNPGFLSAEKFQVHRVNAMKIRSYQEAIKILYDAGIDLNSATAEELLKDAKISSEVIEGVKSFAALDRGYKAKAPQESLDSNTTSKKASLFNKVIPQNIDFEGINLINDITNESNPPARRPKLLASKRLTLPPMRSDMEGEEFSLGQSDVPRLPLSVSAGLAVDPICICQRCFKLQQYGTVEQSLRPGWSSHDLLTPERFESLLEEIKKTKAVVLCIIDVFDLHGSLLPNLREIAGNNPIVVAVNKYDLLPSHTNEERLRSWIVTEIRDYCNLQSPRDVDFEKRDRLQRIRSQEEKAYVRRVDESGVLRSENVHMISCQTGKNIESLLSKVMTMSEAYGEKVYVIGAANVGKSSFINRLIAGSSSKNSKHRQSRKGDVPQPTVSNLPGTTLDMLKLRLPNGVSVFDTPGLINKGQLTAKLTIDELKKVIPIKPVNAITLRVSENKTVLIGGLARVELAEVSLYLRAKSFGKC
jgi:ribosome biogenesis GTPase A